MENANAQTYLSLLDECSVVLNDVESLLNVLIDSREDATAVLRAQGVYMRNELQLIGSKIRAVIGTPDPIPAKSGSLLSNIPDLETIVERGRTESESTIYTEMGEPRQRSIMTSHVPNEDRMQDSGSEESYEDMGSALSRQRKLQLAETLGSPESPDQLFERKASYVSVQRSSSLTSADYGDVSKADLMRSDHKAQFSPHSRTIPASKGTGVSHSPSNGGKRSRSLTNDLFSNSATDIFARLDEDEAAYSMQNARKRRASGFAQPQCTGYMEKRGGLGGRTWQERYFVLDSGFLYFYVSARDKHQRNQLQVSQYETQHDIEHSTKKRPAFKMTPLRCAGKEKAAKTYFFRSSDQKEHARWVKTLQAVAEAAASRQQSTSVADEPEEQVENTDEHKERSDGDDTFDGGVEYYQDPQNVHPTKMDLNLNTSSDFGDELTRPVLSPGNEQNAVASSDTLTTTTSYTYQPILVMGVEAGRKRDGSSATAAPNPSHKTDNFEFVISPIEGEKAPAAEQRPLPDLHILTDGRKLPGGDHTSKGQEDSNKTIDALLSPTKKQRGGPGITLPTPEQPLFVDTQSIFLQLPDRPLYDDIYVALWNYTAKASNELSFRRGDLIWVENRNLDPNGAWWVGRKQMAGEDLFNGDRGLFISSYVESAYELLE